MTATRPRGPRLARLSSGAAAGVAVALAATGLAVAAGPPAGPAVATDRPPGYAGVPIDPTPFTVNQPDGTPLMMRRFGDALSNGVRTLQGGYTVVRGGDGWWRYAAGLTSDGDLEASSVVVGQGAVPPASRGLAPTPSFTDVPSLSPRAGTGVAHQLVILAQFTDQASVGSTQAQWQKRFFGNTGSVTDYYSQASGGQFDLQAAHDTNGADNGVIGWLTLPEDHPNTVEGPDTYVADAIVAAAPYVDYRSYDADHDGAVEPDELHVTVIAAGYESSYVRSAEPCGPGVWGHQWSFTAAGLAPPTVNGVTIGAGGYTTFGESHCDQVLDDPGHPATIGPIAHELGHDLGWPDLYDADQSSSGVGDWSLMATGAWASDGTGQEPGDSPSYPDAWSRSYQGWITPTAVVSTTQDVSLPVGAAVLVSPNPGGVDWQYNDASGTGEYFLVENRQQTGYDASLPGCGLLVYRVDETVPSDRSANSNESDPLLKVIQAGGNDSLAKGLDLGNFTDPYPGAAANPDLTDSTVPNSRFHTGLPSGLNLHVDSTSCTDPMTVDVVPGSSEPPPSTGPTPSVTPTVTPTATPTATPPPTSTPTVSPVGPPGNDAFAKARTLSGKKGTTRGTTTGATHQAGERVFAAGKGGRSSVWFRWTAKKDGKLVLTATGSFKPLLATVKGTRLARLSVLGADTTGATAKVVVRVRAGKTYRIDLDGKRGGTGAYAVSWAWRV